MTECPKCGSDAIKFGFKKGIQRYQCRKCKHVFLQTSASSPVFRHISTGGEASEQHERQPLYTQEQEDVRDVATEIIGSLGVGEKQPEQEQYYEQPEHEKRKQPEPEPKLNPKDFNAPIQIGHFIGETIGDLLNNVFFKKAEKKKEHEQSELDYI
jgi:hypothetical protein